MGRQARKLSNTGLYHIFFHGINRQPLFEGDSDFVYFRDSMQQLKSDMAFELYAYCLMNEHVHLLIKENQKGDISLAMKRLLTKYAMYFNRKYERKGALVANRFKSTPVEVNENFIPLICYIHQNPLKTGIVNQLEDYQYSSYLDYVQGGNLTDTVFSLNLVGKEEWLRLHQIIIEDHFDVAGKIRLSEEKMRHRILQHTNGCEPHEIAVWPKQERDACIRQLKEVEGFSIRQIERMTGISRGVIAKS